MKNLLACFWILMGLSVHFVTKAQPQVKPPANIKLADIQWRDMCVYPDPVSKTYYMVGPGWRSVRLYTSKDLLNWYGPTLIYEAPKDVWGDIPVVGIWAPELHAYKGKYYLFLTFDTHNNFPEQWRDWLPRVTRGSQVLVSDSITGSFKTFFNHSTTPVDMMTLDGTLWVEDGAPYMVFSNEWVQITNGSICYIKLKEDLSEAIAEPVRLFHADEAAWSRGDVKFGNRVTDGPYLYKGKTGKLYMLWTSGGPEGMATGIAISESGKIAGPWLQQAESVYNADGGHAMLFKTFEGKLMMILHSPYNGGTRPHVFEMEDTGNTLRITRELKE